LAKINKIRIVNFIYDGGNTAIKDEIFDFFNGKNALINQANGAGKTSIIHFIMQVVKPKVKIAKRDIYKYFLTNRNTAHAIIEWKLGENEYVITGICMKKWDGGESNDVEYFTYIGEYGFRKSPTIRSIPIIEDDCVIPFDTIKSELKTLSNNVPSFKVYSHSQGADYKKDMETFGIFQEEWDLVAKINQDEGALVKLFEDSKTTKAIMEKWILSSIEDSVKSGNTQNFAEMIEKNADNFSRLKKGQEEIQIYKDFKIDLNALKEQSLKLDLCKQEYDSSIIEMGHFNNYIKGLSENSQKDLLQSKVELSMAEELFLDARFKEKSFLYRTDESSLNSQKEKLEDITKKLGLLNERYNTVKSEKTLLEARITYDEIETKINKLQQKNFELESMKKSDAEINQELDKVKYSLRIKYEEMLYEVDSTIKIINSDLKKSSESHTELKMGETLLGEEIQQKKDTLSRLDEKIETFKKFEGETLKKIRPKTLFIFEDTLNDEINDKNGFLKEIETLSNNLKSVERNELELDNEREQLNKENIRFQKEKTKVDERIENYLTEKEKVSSSAETYRVSLDDYTQNEMMEHLTDKKEPFEIRYKDLEITIYDLSKKINSIQKGIFNSSDSLEEILRESGIEYLQGLEWIKQQSKEDRQKYLKLNPLLPYSIIVSQKELQIIKKLDFANIDFIVPIIVKESLVIEFEERELDIVKFNEKSYFIVSYNEGALIDEEQIMQYRDKLLDDKSRLEEEQRTVANTISGINNITYSLKAFYSKFSHISIDKLFTEQKELSIKLDSYNSRLTGIINELYGLKETRENLNKGIWDADRNLSSVNQRIDIINEYFGKKKEIEQSIEQKKTIVLEVGKLTVKLTEIKGEIENTGKVIMQFNIDLVQQQSEYNDIHNQYSFYKQCSQSDIISTNVDELKNKEKALEKCLSNPAKQKEIEDEIQIIGEDIDKRQTVLNGYEISKEEIKSVKFERFRYENITQEEKELNASIETAKKEEETENNIFHREDALCKKTADDIIKEFGEPIYNFDNLSDDVLENIRQEIRYYGESVSSLKKHINEVDNNLKEYDRTLKLLRTSMTSLDIEYSFILNIEGTGSNIQIVDNDEYVNALSKKYKEALNNFTKAKNSMRSKYDEINIKNLGTKVSGIVKFLSSLANSELLYISHTLNDHIERQNRLIDKRIEVISEEIIEISKDKENIVLICNQYVDSILENVKEFDSKSQIMLENGKPRKMLSLVIPPIPHEREVILKGYISECIDEIIMLKELNKTQKEIMEVLIHKLSTKALIDAVTPLSNYTLYVFKPKENTQKVFHTAWDDMESDTSGGEGFAGAFFLFTTILTYIRYKKLASLQDGSFRNFFNDTKSLIMDNPFGKMSSEHLLKTVFALAKQYNLQVVCFTDLKNNAIFNRFNLIYALNSVYTDDNRRYIVKELLKGQTEDVEEVFVKEVKQLMLFDMFENL
jgi:chromosome segregation ATPase